MPDVNIGSILGNKPEINISTSKLQNDNPREWVRFLRQVNEERFRQHLLKYGVVIQSEADWNSLTDAINNQLDITGKLTNPQGKPIVISLVKVMKGFPINKKQMLNSKILFVK